MTKNDRAWVEEFEAYFDDAGMAGVSAHNVAELIRIAKRNGDGPDDGVNQAFEDHLEQIDLIGRLDR